jgi:glycosyltransferase involved in cell wall biosynthesis
MKVLFDHSAPFALAHGGFQTQIQQSKAGLERLGLEVEYLRWWDDRQSVDLIHYFGAPSAGYLRMAQEKGIPVVVTHLFTATCNRSPLQLEIQGLITRTLLALPGWGMIKSQLNWRSFQMADRMVVGLQAEQRVLQKVFAVPERKIARVALGLHHDFLQASKPSRKEPWLITTGTITNRKRCVELARMAQQAERPVLFVGKPYHRDDPYWKEFSTFIDNRFVFHREHVDSRAEMIALLQSSRGFVIYSQFENWCLSAHEAVACGLPVLVPDLPWSRECFGTEAAYLDAGAPGENPGKLRAFYDECPGRPAPAIKLYSWDDVARQLLACYQSLLPPGNDTPGAPEAAAS